MTISGKYAASNFFFTQGVLIDLEKRCFRMRYRYLSLFRSIASCAPLPKVSYVLLFKTLYAKCEACNIEDFEKSGLVQLSLVYGRNRRLIVNETEDRALAFAQATELAAALGVKIRDSASNRRSPTWIQVAPEERISG